MLQKYTLLYYVLILVTRKDLLCLRLLSLVNPVTGEEIGQPGQFYTPPREHAAPSPQSIGSQERFKNRIPPGGFSSPLW